MTRKPPGGVGGGGGGEGGTGEEASNSSPRGGSFPTRPEKGKKREANLNGTRSKFAPLKTAGRFRIERKGPTSKYGTGNPSITPGEKGGENLWGRKGIIGQSKGI